MKYFLNTLFLILKNEKNIGLSIEYGHHHQMSNISEKWFFTRLSKTHCRPYSKEIIFKPPTRQKLHNYVQKAKDGFHKTKKQKYNGKCHHSIFV